MLEAFWQVKHFQGIAQGFSSHAKSGLNTALQNLEIYIRIFGLRTICITPLSTFGGGLNTPGGTVKS